MTPKERYQKLEQHLAEENPVLLDVIKNYRELDKIAYRLGLLPKNKTYAEQISWWPLISVLGTFSAGKSSFINSYTDQKVQSTGNQAVDDKFTVLCYGHNELITTLPGLALDSDPRFPFFGISKEIDKVEEGEGSKIDNYLQLKTVNSDILKAKILIDSPGFDADSQRDSTLRITNHIIEMSDLVLVFFDARHPEPGAMRDTLQHLVSTTIGRKDSDKVLYILNQIDTAAQEDNPEEVIGSWQRAISGQGLVSGNFYTIYNEEVANPIDDQALAERFKRKKDMDMQGITHRMDQVSVQRTYRIANSLEHIIEDIHVSKIPKIEYAIASWRRKVLITDAVLFSVLAVIIFYGLQGVGAFEIPIKDWSLVKLMMSSPLWGSIISAAVLMSLFSLHWFVRSKFSNSDARRISEDDPQTANAFKHNTRFWRGMFPNAPRGWSKRNRRKLNKIVLASKAAIQKLNDQFANPAGDKSVTHDNKVTNTEVENSPETSKVESEFSTANQDKDTLNNTADSDKVIIQEDSQTATETKTEKA